MKRTTIVLMALALAVFAAAAEPTLAEENDNSTEPGPCVKVYAGVPPGVVVDPACIEEAADPDE